VELDILQERLDVDLAEGDVAFSAIVEDAVAAADGGLIPGSIGEAETRTKGAAHLIEAARRACRNQRIGCGIDVGNAFELIGRNAASGADQTVVWIARAGNDLAPCDNGDGAGGVVNGGIEVGHIVALRIHGGDELPANTILDAEIPGRLPGVLSESLGLIEAEVAGRIGAGFVVAVKVAEQCIGESVAGGVRVSAGVEADVAGIARPPVLVDTVTDIDAAELEEVIALDDRNRITQLNVGGGRVQSKVWSLEAGERGDADLRNAIRVGSRIGEEFGVLEAEGLALPVHSVGRNVLRDEAEGRDGLVDD